MSAFRKPWTDGARAYHEADTVEAAIEGFKRVRTVKDFILTNGGAADLTCAGCGEGFDGDAYAEYHPRTKTVTDVRHYVCRWTDTLQRVEDLGRAMR